MKTPLQRRVDRASVKENPLRRGGDVRPFMGGLFAGQSTAAKNAGELPKTRKKGKAPKPPWPIWSSQPFRWLLATVLRGRPQSGSRAQDQTAENFTSASGNQRERSKREHDRKEGQDPGIALP